MASAETSTAPWLDPEAEAVAQAVAEAAAGQEVVDGVEHQLHHHHHLHHQHHEHEMSGAEAAVLGAEHDELQQQHEDASAYASLDSAAYIDASGYVQPEEGVSEYTQEQQQLDEHGQAIVEHHHHHLHHVDVEMAGEAEQQHQTAEEYEAAAAQAAAEAEAYGVEAVVGEDEQMAAAAMLEGAAAAAVTGEHENADAAALTEEGEVYRGDGAAEAWQAQAGEEGVEAKAEEEQAGGEWGEYQAPPQHHLQHQHHLQRSVPLQEYGDAFAAYSNVSNTAAAAALGLLQQATGSGIHLANTAAPRDAEAAAAHEAVVLAAAVAQQQQAQAAVAAAAHHAAHQEPSGGVQRRQKFKRSRTGCLVCRKRKVKCSQDGQPCKQCKIGKRDCHYEENPPKRKRRTRGEQEAEAAAAAAAAALVAQQAHAMQEHGEASGSAMQELDPQTGLPYHYVDEGGAGSASWTTEYAAEGHEATEEEQAAYYDEAQHAALVEAGGEVYTAEHAQALLEQQAAIDAEAQAAHDAQMALHHEHEQHAALHDEHGEQEQHAGVGEEEYAAQGIAQQELDAATQLTAQAHAEQEAAAVTDPLSYVQEPHELDEHAVHDEHAGMEQHESLAAAEQHELLEHAQLEGVESSHHAQLEEQQHGVALEHEATLEEQQLHEHEHDVEQQQQLEHALGDEEHLPLHDDGLGVEGEQLVEAQEQ